LVRDRELTEDLFQETFIKVIHTLKSGKYNEEGKFLPWVMRIAHNLVIDHFRRVKKMPLVRSNDDHDVFATIAQPGKNVEQQIVNVQIDADVRKLIDSLPDEQRQVVMMRTYLGMSFKEIAEHTEVSINTALGRMRYALDQHAQDDQETKCDHTGSHVILSSTEDQSGESVLRVRHFFFSDSDEIFRGGAIRERGARSLNTKRTKPSIS
jgi:RNA polymerase sigma-70 factor (ECF subfamily)